MEPEPVFGKAALLIGDALVISDLHLGIEYFLERKGIKIPSQWRAMAEEVIGLQKETSAKRLIINGDLKHGIPAGKREFRDTRLFIKEISSVFDEITLVKGNHDGGLQNEVGHIVDIVPGSGFVFEGVGIFHGHAWPSDDVLGADVLVMGHMHPAFEFMDSIGNSQKEPCWVRGIYGNRRLIVMPAMSRFYGGASVNRGEFLGPVLRSSDFAIEGIFLLNGTRVQ